MKLVWRKTPRGTVERSLTQAETEALCDTYGAGRTATKEQQDLVRDITGQMIEDSLWLQCSCHPDFPPLNTVVDKASGRHLRHLHQSGRHSPSCPLFRVKKTGTDTETGHREGHKHAFAPLDVSAFITLKKESGKGTGVRDLTPGSGGKEERIKKVPALGRKLLTLLDMAAIHRLTLIPKTPSGSMLDTLKTIKRVAGSVKLHGDRVLADVIMTPPWLTQQDLENTMTALEMDNKGWPARTRIGFYLIGLTREVDRQTVTFNTKTRAYTWSPAKRMTVNGEHNALLGSRAPYWVILSFFRDEAGKVICDEGYAHSAWSMVNPIPVDSLKEKDTLETIVREVGKLRKKPARLTLEKPLFDIESGPDGEELALPVLPDFLVRVRPDTGPEEALFCIETMGYDSEEYLERKKRTHAEMAKLGKVITDPDLRAGKDFSKTLLGYIAHADTWAEKQ
ncbi:hypothetical protein [Mangrovibacter phragmitis]|uniref:hypothetical protein n=1 Tax=Mangrovibacter phragmitis TaxID=1691903 RepID=UPI00336A3D8C